MTDQAKSSALLPVPGVAGRPIPLPGNDIDTDRIIPARFMTAITFDGLGELAFRDARFGGDGKPLDHPMNDPRFQAKGPRIAIVNKNFGCGSSREHAPWAIDQYGFRCVIAPSFADIFFNNCFKNGLLPIVLPEATVAQLFDAYRQFYQYPPDLALAIATSQSVLTKQTPSFCWRKTQVHKRLVFASSTLLFARWKPSRFMPCMTSMWHRPPGARALVICCCWRPSKAPVSTACAAWI